MPPKKGRRSSTRSRATSEALKSPEPQQHVAYSEAAASFVPQEVVQASRGWAPKVEYAKLGSRSWGS